MLRHGLLILLICFLLTQTGKAEEVPSRTSHWATGGESLVEEKQEIPFLEREELFNLLKEGEVIFLDTRENKEFVKQHLPNALNMPFSERAAMIPELSAQYRLSLSNQKIVNHVVGTVPETTINSIELLNEAQGQNRQVTIVPYCNWDFRAYVSSLELKKAGVQNLYMMYPHGLRAWEAAGLPMAGELSGKRDDEAWEELMKVAWSSPHAFPPHSAGRIHSLAEIGDDKQTGDDNQRMMPRAENAVREIDMRILKTKVEPRHIEASVGEHLTLKLHAEEEAHWFVIPDFGVNVRLKPGELKTVELDIKKPGYFPYGCISCCSRYQCQVKQAILVDLKLPPSFYGE